MSLNLRAARLSLALFSAVCATLGCGDDGDEGAGPTNTGQACSAPEQCYLEVEAGELLGDAECLDRVEGGYCTHACSQDSDCCAAAGECIDERAQVCSPFESSPSLYCFLACEKSDVDASDAVDENDFCQRYANAAFRCRSSGGGSENRKVCVP